jgi:hypothetical protein
MYLYPHSRLLEWGLARTAYNAPAGFVEAIAKILADRVVVSQMSMLSSRKALKEQQKSPDPCS